MSIEFSNQSLSKSISAAPSTGRGIVEAEVLVVFLTEGALVAAEQNLPIRL